MIEPRDHHGHVIAETESPDTVITVWEIEPALDTTVDYAVIRCYQNAVRYAKAVVEKLMDDPEREYPASVDIRQAQMRLWEFEELEERMGDDL